MSAQRQLLFSHGLPAQLADVVNALPSTVDVLVCRPKPAVSLARRGGLVQDVPSDTVESLHGCFKCVVDAGALAAAGFAMDLGKFQWDALGRVEEVIREVWNMLACLEPRGRLFVQVKGDPIEYLVSYLTAFPNIDARPLTGAASGVYQFSSEVLVTQAHLDAVLTHELVEERSHKRYSDLLDATLVGKGLEILDVGGGDGHMAEWWQEVSGHRVSLLEVDAEQATAAAKRLGTDRVTLIDGVSPWPFEDASFDVCLLLHVLHHILPEPALRLTLSEARRVSRRQVLIFEDQPRAVTTPGMGRLAVAVTAQHFRPFGQDPNVYMRNIRPDSTWRTLFSEAGLLVEDVRWLPGTLQHPVPHTLYDLRPSQ